MRRAYSRMWIISYHNIVCFLVVSWKLSIQNHHISHRFIIFIVLRMKEYPNIKTAVFNWKTMYLSVSSIVDWFRSKSWHFCANILNPTYGAINMHRDCSLLNEFVDGGDNSILKHTSCSHTDTGQETAWTTFRQGGSHLRHFTLVSLKKA